MGVLNKRILKQSKPEVNPFFLVFLKYELIWFFPGVVGRLLKALGSKATVIVRIEAPDRCGARAPSPYRRTEPEPRRKRRARESAGAVRVRVEPQAVVVVRVVLGRVRG